MKKSVKESETMKLNATKIEQAAAWVEAHGLYPQPLGASVSEFCKAMGVGRTTYRRWVKTDQMEQALIRAREKFRAQTVRDVSRAVIDAAKGQTETREVEARTASGELVRFRETIRRPPDIRAAVFVLTNLDPANWRLKPETQIQVAPAPLRIVVESEKGAEDLRRAIEAIAAK